MKKFSFNSVIRKQQPKVIFIEAIWKSWHRNLSISTIISNGIAEKKKRIFMFFLVFSYGISTTLLQILSSLRFPVYQVKDIHWCSRKSCSIWTFGSIRPGVLKKQLLQKFLHTLHTFQRNIQCWVLFKYTCEPSWDYSKKLFRAAILQAGIHPSNLDVRYLVQKKTIFSIEFLNWILMYIFLFVCL